MKKIMINLFFGIGAMAVISTATPAISATENALLAGGCFWCVESDFKKLEGVGDPEVGYSGGTIPNPTYQNYNDVNLGFEPHVEVTKIPYDSTVVDYAGILDFFLRHIDPTDGGGQFCDRGAAYRPVIYYHNDAEKAIAEDKLKQAAAELNQTLAVDLLPATQFWAAEEYHQDYHVKNTLRYNYYRWSCGRDQRVEELWGTAKQ